MVVCVVKGKGVNPLINMGPLKLFSSSFFGGIEPHIGSVYPHIGWLCYGGVERETPDNHGVLNVVFQYSSSCHRGKDPHSGSVCPHSGCCVVRGGGPLVNMGPLKLFSSSVLFGIDPHSGSVYPHSGCLCYEWMVGKPR